MINSVKNLVQKKFFKNVMHVFSGTAVSSVLAVLNTAVMVRALGLEEYGILFMAMGYTGFFSALFNFQSFEAVIKFLPYVLDKKDGKAQNYIQLAIIVDVFTAVVAFIVAYSALPFAAKFLEWSPEVLGYIRIFSFSILFNVAGIGVFNGILRVFDKYKIIAGIGVLTACVNLITAVIGLSLKASLSYYVFAAILSVFVTFIAMLYFTIRTLRENNISKINVFRTEFDREFVIFAVQTNLCSTLDLPIKQITPFIINKYMGFSDIAVFKILEKIGQMLSKVIDVIGLVLMPEISKKLSRGERKGAYKMMFKLFYSVWAVGIAGLVFVFLTHSYWLFLLIPDYSQYFDTVILYLVYIIFIQSFSAQNMLFTFGGFLRFSIPILVVVNSLYLIFLVPVVETFLLNGLIGLKLFQAALIFLIKGVIMNRLEKKYEKTV